MIWPWIKMYKLCFILSFVEVSILCMHGGSNFHTKLNVTSYICINLFYRDQLVVNFYFLNQRSRTWIKIKTLVCGFVDDIRIDSQWKTFLRMLLPLDIFYWTISLHFVFRLWTNISSAVVFCLSARKMVALPNMFTSIVYIYVAICTIVNILNCKLVTSNFTRF